MEAGREEMRLQVNLRFTICDLRFEKPQATKITIKIMNDETADWKLEIEKLAPAAGDILLVTVPREALLTPGVMTSLNKTFTNLCHGTGVRVLIRNADIAVDVLADLLTADDLARMAARMEQKALAGGHQSPIQNKTEKLNIILNGIPVKCGREVTYEQIIVAAGYKPDRIISVTYHPAPTQDVGYPGGPSMILVPGRKALVADGMIFNTADTSGA